MVLLNVKQFDDAQVLAVHCHFDKPAKHERIWHRWTNASRMIEFLATDPHDLLNDISVLLRESSASVAIRSETPGPYHRPAGLESRWGGQEAEKPRE